MPKQSGPHSSIPGVGESLTMDSMQVVVSFNIDPIAGATIDENTTYTGPLPALSGDAPVGNVTYTLGRTDANLFTIDSSTGEVSMIARDFEIPEDANADNIYELIITATDDNANNASEDWRVTVLDINKVATFYH